MRSCHMKAAARAAAATVALLVASSGAIAENIAVGNYGVVGERHAVRRRAGERLLQGGGRQRHRHRVVAGRRHVGAQRDGRRRAYGEANPGAIAVAIQQGADIKIVSDNVLTVAEFVWAVKKDSPIKTIKDLKGRKIGYTNPRSTSQALAILLLRKAGYEDEGRRAGQDRRLRPRARRARPRPDRRRADDRAAVVEGQGQVPRADHRRAKRCRRSTTSSAWRPARRRETRGDFIRARHPRAPPRGRVHDQESRRGGRHRRQGLQHRRRRSRAAPCAT